MDRIPFALQLYTVRDHLARELDPTLKAVSAAGYAFVEVGDTYGLSPEEFRQHLAAAKLKPISVHVGYEDVTQRPEQAIALARTYGIGHVAIGGIDPKHTPDRDGWIACGKALDAAGTQLRSAGIRLSYHNHAHEFEKIGGDYKLDLLLGAADPKNLCAQIDVFWVKYARLNPVDVITRLAGRCPLIHIKDMLDERSRTFAEIGSGILNWPAIFEAAHTAGVEWHIVEQDASSRDSIRSVEMSAQFITHL